MKHAIRDKHYWTFRVYSQKKPVIIKGIMGKFKGRKYRIKKTDKESGVYTFLLANPNLALRANNHPEKIINEIKLCFHPEEGDYSVDAVCSAVYIKDGRIIEGMGLAQTSLEGDEIKFGKGRVRKTLIEILEDP